MISELGGGVPVRDEVIINLANMNQVRSFDPVSGTYMLKDFGTITEGIHRHTRL
jgi:hypothetical protein